jgi:VCBS repeat-containing protein
VDDADALNDAISTPENTPVTINVLGNDTFEDASRHVSAINGTPFAGSASIALTHGTVSIASDGTLTYTPDAGYSGPDNSFTYTVSANDGAVKTASVTVNVGAGSDPQTIDTGDIPYIFAHDLPKAPPIDPDGRVFEIKNFVYVEPVIRGEPLPTESRVFLEPVIRASQKEAQLASMRIDEAATPEVGSPLFDAFGLSAPKTEFVSPMSRDGQRPQADTEPPSSSRTSEKGIDNLHTESDGPSQSQQTSAAPRGAPSFSAQLRRSSTVVRTRGIASSAVSNSGVTASPP